MSRETSGGGLETRREKGAISQYFNRAGLAFRWPGIRADGLNIHGGYHISKQQA